MISVMKLEGNGQGHCSQILHHSISGVAEPGRGQIASDNFQNFRLQRANRGRTYLSGDFKILGCKAEDSDQFPLPCNIL